MNNRVRDVFRALVSLGSYLMFCSLDLLATVVHDPSLFVLSSVSRLRK